MPAKHHLTPVSLTPMGSLPTLVEHRRVVDMESCQLNVFETHQTASRVHLQFDNLLLTSMMRGKKVMHLPNRPAFDYLPGESVLVRPQETMIIDFPDATFDEPTQCIALAISGEAVKGTMDMLNENFPKLGRGEQWDIDDEFVHLTNDRATAGTIERMVNLGMFEQGKHKDILASLALQELLVRLMQGSARSLFARDLRRLHTSHPLAAVMAYIESHLTERLDVADLASIACMSRAHFQRKFKEAFGWTPKEFVTHARIEMAKKMLRSTGANVQEVAYACGFNGSNPFIRAFSAAEGITPKQYAMRAHDASLRA